MTRLRLRRNEDQFEYTGDIDRLVQIFSERGYDISFTDAGHAWEQYSDSMCAGWLMLDRDDEYVFNSIFHYFEEA